MRDSFKEDQACGAISAVHSSARSCALLKESPATPARSGAPASIRASFDALYRTHAPFVSNALRRLGVPAASIDDATQEVFIVVIRRLHELRAGMTERAWLYAIAQRVAWNQRRWVRRKGSSTALSSDASAANGSPLENAIRRERCTMLLEFLDELDEPRRLAFILMELEQMTGAEAHAASGVNPNTLYARQRFARQALRLFLTRRGALPLVEGQ